MSIVTTNRPVDLVQLDAEVAVAAGLDSLPGLSMTDDGHERIIRCDHEAVTQTMLDDVIDAHVPEPEPPSPTALLQRQVNELTDLILFGF